MTSDLEIKDIVSKLNFKTPFRGVFMRNELSLLKKPLSNECGIINLNSNDVSPEENKKTGHWQAWFVKDNKKYFFDSFGCPCSKEMISYLGKLILTSTLMIQDFTTAICGELCILFLYLMDNGLSYTDTVLNLYDMRIAD